MPTLKWIGKDKVINHPLEVPFRTLDHKYSVDEPGRRATNNNSENIIIKICNLKALEALLQQHEGNDLCGHKTLYTNNT